MSTDSTPIHGRLRMTEQDVAAGLRGMGSSRYLLWFYVGVVVIGTLTAVASGAMVKEPGSIVPILGLNAGLAALLFFGPRAQARKVARALRLDEGDVSFRFDGDSVSIHAPGATTSTAYTAIPTWRESPHTFLLSCGPNAANIVPKRAFQPGDVERVRALLAANIQPASVPARKAVRKTFFVWLALIVVFFVVWLILNPQADKRVRPEPPTTVEPR